jgi:uncharacterized protein (DUF2141 family)
LVSIARSRRSPDLCRFDSGNSVAIHPISILLTGGSISLGKEEAEMRTVFLSMLLAAAVLANAQESAPAGGGGFILTVIVENVNKEGGSIGVLVFNATRGWPEDRFAAFKDVVVPARPGTVNVVIPGLPAGDYALAILHDVNQNHKLDKNLFGVPKEQWGMSNNPHATIKAPPFSAAKFSLSGDMEVRVRMQ